MNRCGCDEKYTRCVNRRYTSDVRMRTYKCSKCSASWSTIEIPATKDAIEQAYKLVTRQRSAASTHPVRHVRKAPHERGLPDTPDPMSPAVRKAMDRFKTALAKRERVLSSGELFKRFRDEPK